jgi:hypothetical protein
MEKQSAAAESRTGRFCNQLTRAQSFFEAEKVSTQILIDAKNARPIGANNRRRSAGFGIKIGKALIL